MKHITLKRMVAQDLSDFVAVMTAYLSEIAPDLDLDPSEDAEECLAPDSLSFWVLSGGEKVGFILISRLKDGTLDLGEFSIFPEHRRQGLGFAAVEQLLHGYPGRWTLGVAGGSASAEEFWDWTLAKLTRIRNLHRIKPRFPSQTRAYLFDVIEGAQG